MIRKVLKNNWLLWLILLLALGVRLWGITFGLPGIDHGDESEVVNHAVRFGSGDLNPHRFQYGSLVQYVLFLLYGLYFAWCYFLGAYTSVHEFALAFVQDPTAFYLIARGLSALLGVATVYVTFVIGRRLSGSAAGLLAAGFLALCYQHALHSHYATVDCALAFFFTLALHRCLVLHETGALRDYCLAGLLAGLACSVKFNGIFTLVPLLAAHFFRTQETASAKIISKKLAAAVACVLAGHALTSPFFYMELGAVQKEIYELNAMHRGAGFSLPAYMRLLLGPDLWGLPLGLLCLWGVVSAFWRDRRLAILGVSAVAIFLFVSRYRYVEGKYILYCLPMLAALAAASIPRYIMSRWPLLASAVVLVAFCSFSCVRILDWDRYHAARSINLEAQDWIEQHVPPGARILLDNTGNGGPKLANNPANIQRQYERAASRGLLKAEFLKLQAELKPGIYFNIVLVDAPEGSRQDDYAEWRSWQDLETVGMPAAYYRNKGFDYLIITNRYFDAIGPGFVLVKEFARQHDKIRIYRVPDAPQPLTFSCPARPPWV